MRYLIVILLFHFSPALHSFECSTTKIRFLKKKKWITNNAKLCTKTTNNSFLFLSESCLKKDCRLLLQKKKLPAFSTFIGKRKANPFFGFCKYLGGKAFLGEIYHNKAWNKTNWCVGKSGTNLIGLDTLYLVHYKNLGLKNLK